MPDAVSFRVQITPEAIPLLDNNGDKQVEDNELKLGLSRDLVTIDASGRAVPKASISFAPAAAPETLRNLAKMGFGGDQYVSLAERKVILEEIYRLAQPGSKVAMQCKMTLAAIEVTRDAERRDDLAFNRLWAIANAPDEDFRA